MGAGAAQLAYGAAQCAGVAEGAQGGGVAMSWIKCSERMPGVDGPMVLVATQFGSVRATGLGMWDARRAEWLNVNLQSMPDWFVTHWQPLPEPPHE